jgi:glutaryl-CoA dehydrogenase
MHFEKIGSFGLTEPWSAPPRVAECSRPAAGREDDVLVLDGQRKCIGTATFADIAVIWAREEGSNQVKGFVVGRDNRVSRSRRSRPR